MMSEQENNILDNAYKVAKIEEAARKRDEGDQVQPEHVRNHFNPLGHHRGQFSFITTRGKQVLQFKASHLAIRANLYMLAPLGWWEREFPSAKGFTGKVVDQVVNYLINECYSRGVFHLDRMRGLGAWWDDGRAVIHAGDRLIIDGSPVPLHNFQSRYVYEALPSLSIELSNPLPTKEANRLFEFASLLNWEKPIYGTFYAGWATIAMVCGAIPWRPHLFITGPSGGGKTWVVKQLQKLLGEFVLAAKGETTAAGLRQELKHNAMPVLFDEAEGEDKWTESNINKILGLMRQASSDDEGKILKGGADGSPDSYIIRSAFCLSAIRNPIKQTADENRITVLTLNKNDDDGLAKFHQQIDPLAREIFSAEWTSRFRARVITHLPILRKNIEIFAQAAGEYFKSQRMGDQVAPLLAGAYLLHSDKEISADTALHWIQEKDWLDQLQVQDESDEDKVLTALLESVIRVPVDRGSIDLSVGELIRSVSSSKRGIDIDPGIAGKTLARHGILVDGSRVIISNTHRAIKHLLRDTGWDVGWGKILKRIDGADGTRDKKSFAGAKSRAVSIPIAVIVTEDSG